MTLPSDTPNDDLNNDPLNEPLPLPDQRIHLPSPRGRRRRRASAILVRPSLNARAEFLENMARRAYPTYEFFIYAVLCGAVLGIGFMLDSQAILVFGALIAPLLTPWVGVALATVTGSGRYFFQALVGLLIAGVLIFGTGLLAGFAAQLFMPLVFDHAFHQTHLWWPDLALLAVGSILLVVSFARSEEKPFLPSVMLAFELFLPLSAAGFGLGVGVPGLWPDGLITFAIHLALATVLGVIVFIILGFRPLTFAGYSFSGTLALIVVVVIIGASGIGTALTSQWGLPLTQATPTTPPTEEPTQAPTLSLATVQSAYGTTTPDTPTPRPTVTLTPAPSDTPSLTPTQLILPTTPAATSTSTPQPTPVYARVFSDQGGGIVIRESPSGSAITTIQNGILVQILPETEKVDGVIWVHVIAIIGDRNIEGWVVQNVLVTATPAPNWQPSATPTKKP